MFEQIVGRARDSENCRFCCKFEFEARNQSNKGHQLSLIAASWSGMEGAGGCESAG
jgi:hypothetical protein